MFKIGTFADWFGVGLLEGIKASQASGAEGVQIYAWNDFSPLTASRAQIQLVKATAQNHSQEIVALCGELGGYGLEIREENPDKILYFKELVNMGMILDCSILTTHIGVIPEDTASDKYKIMQETCHTIGENAADSGSVVAIETGPEKITQLKSFVDSCGTKGIAINYDPANLIMVTDDDEVKGVHTAGSSIVHTHAKDGIMYEYVGPEKVYELFAEGGIEALNKTDKYFKEMPLGQGSVRWKDYLTALKDIGYNGYLTIEREAGENGAADIKMAVDFLKEIIPTI